MIRRTAQTESLCYNNEVFSIRNGIIYNVDSPVDISEVQIAEVSSVWEAYKSASIKSFWFGTQSIDNGEQVADESDRRTFDDADVYYEPGSTDYGFSKRLLGWVIIR